MRTITNLFVTLFLFAPALAVAGEWSAEQYEVGDKVFYREGETYHVELIPVCRNDKVDAVARDRLPSQYHKDLVNVVLEQGAATIARGDQWVNLIMRDVDPDVATKLPVLDASETVIGYIEPNYQDSSVLRYDGLSLDGVLVVVTPLEFWSGENPGLEMHTDFPLYYNPAGEQTIKTKAGSVSPLLRQKLPAITFWLITDCP